MRASAEPTTFLRQLRTHLPRLLPRLLREDVEVRGQVIAALSDYLTTREETEAILNEIRRMREDFDRGMDEHSARLEEQGKRIEEQGKRIDVHTRTLGAIGARWGMMTEETFRRSVRSLFADQPDVQVEHWRYHDAEGKVFGYPSDVDMDVVIRDGLLVLIEIKSSISGGDVIEFSRRVALYREVTGNQPTRILMVGPYVDNRAVEVAARSGIEIVAAVSPPEI